MDVLCERCGRTYSLPEGRVTEAGVVIRCTGCGHAFRVRTRAVVTTESVSGNEGLAAESLPPRNWLIRQQNGNVIAFQELRTVRQWIEEGRVTRQDEISRAGEVWRRMGSIPELQGLFEPFDFERPQIPFRLTAPIEGGAEPPGARPVEISVGQGSEAPVARDTAEERRRTQPFEPSFVVNEDPPPHAKRSVRGDAPIIALGSGPDTFSGDLYTPAPEPAFGAGLPESGTPAWAMDDADARPKGSSSNGRPLADTAPLSTRLDDDSTHRLSVAEDSDYDLVARRLRGRKRGRIAVVLVLLLLVAVAVYLYLFQRPFVFRVLGIESASPAPSAPRGKTHAGTAVPARDQFAGTKQVATPHPAVPPAPDAGVSTSPAPTAKVPAAKTTVAGKLPGPASNNAVAGPRGAPRGVTSNAAVDAGVEQPVPVPVQKAPPNVVKKRPPTLRALLRQAERLRDRSPRKALSLYKALLKRKKGWGPAFRGMGWAYLELNEFTLASRSFHKAIRVGTKGDCFIGLGTAYRRLNQRKKALAQFKRYLALYPNGDDVPVAKTNVESLSRK